MGLKAEQSRRRAVATRAAAWWAHLLPLLKHFAQLIKYARCKTTLLLSLYWISFSAVGGNKFKNFKNGKQHKNRRLYFFNKSDYFVGMCFINAC